MNALSPEAARSAWLRVIARDGWRGARADAAAAEAGIDVGTLLSLAGDPFDVVAALLGQVAADSVAAAAAGGSPRDRLFDGIMAGFDALQRDRDGVLALLAARDPGLAALAASRAGRGARHLLCAAGVGVTGPAGIVRQAGLMAILARTLDVWRKDDSRDMAGTMAELDGLLARAESLAEGGLSRLLPDAPWRRDPAPGQGPDPTAE
jgi:hypothetical protein